MPAALPPALSLSRPWSTLVMGHGKDVENRTWTTRYRGPLLVHAAKSWRPDAVAYAQRLGITISAFARDHPAGLLGTVRLVDITCHGDDCGCTCSPWAMPGAWHWHLADPVPLDHVVPARGFVRLWTPGPEVSNELAAAGA